MQTENNVLLPALSYELPKYNSDGLVVPEMTSEQIYEFDTHGWLLMPEVLSGTELKEMQDFANRLHHDPESIPERERNTLGGPLQKLIDLPLVVSLLNGTSFCHQFRLLRLRAQLCFTVLLVWVGLVHITATDSFAFQVMHTIITLFRVKGIVLTQELYGN